MSEAEREARRRMLEAAVASGKATPEEKAELDAQYRRQDKLNQQGYKAATERKAKGGSVGSVGSASRRADGCAVKGKTKGRII